MNSVRLPLVLTAVPVRVGVWLPPISISGVSVLSDASSESCADFVNLATEDVISRYFPQHTVLPKVGLFNAVVLEHGTGTHPMVGTLTLADNVALRTR